MASNEATKAAFEFCHTRWGALFSGSRFTRDVVVEELAQQFDAFAQTRVQHFGQLRADVDRIVQSASELFGIERCIGKSPLWAWRRLVDEHTRYRIRAEVLGDLVDRVLFARTETRVSTPTEREDD